MTMYDGRYFTGHFFLLVKRLLYLYTVYVAIMQFVLGNITN